MVVAAPLVVVLVVCFCCCCCCYCCCCCRCGMRRQVEGNQSFKKIELKNDYIFLFFLRHWCWWFPPPLSDLPCKRFTVLIYNSSVTVLNNVDYQMIGSLIANSRLTKLWWLVDNDPIWCDSARNFITIWYNWIKTERPSTTVGRVCEIIQGLAVVGLSFELTNLGYTPAKPS